MERVGEAAFDGNRLRRSGTWVVGFLADWCPYCRSFAPALEAMERAGGRNVLWAEVNDEESPLWDRFEIRVVPTLLVFRDGAEVFRRDGRFARGLNAKDVTAVEAFLGPASPPPT
ncbi:MAG TPA: thioredoxin family protein [Thermoplasmata archaeon]|nr:thioredoxin family protein [Thermoplasmata archaeon]